MGRTHLGLVKSAVRCLTDNNSFEETIGNENMKCYFSVVVNKSVLNNVIRLFY